jgi:hypothetical protein
MEIIKTKKGDILLDKEDFLILSKFNIHFGNNYPQIYFNGKETYLHRIIMKAKKGDIVDHKNLNKLDNRKENLRFCSQSENGMNRPKENKGNNTFKGVVYNKRKKKWMTRVAKKFIGYFDNEIEAAKAYDKYAKLYFKDFAFTNF